ncbi:MAG: hypothetical protein V4645_14160 [Pseudomonadota bacterium]
MVFLYMAPEKQNPAAGRDALLRGSDFSAEASRQPGPMQNANASGRTDASDAAARHAAHSLRSVPPHHNLPAMTLSMHFDFTPLSRTPVLEPCIVANAAGYDLFTNETVTLAFGTKCVMVKAKNRDPIPLPYFELAELTIENREVATTGETTQGLAGREHISATTQPTLQSFISFVTHLGELHLFYRGMPPTVLRMALAEAFAVWRQHQPEWLEKRRKVVDAYADSEGLDAQTRDALKARLLTPIVPPASAAPLSFPSAGFPTDDVPAPDTFDPATRLGVCPSCNAEIPYFSEECPQCRALFGPDSAWQVRPL